MVYGLSIMDYTRKLCKVCIIAKQMRKVLKRWGVINLRRLLSQFTWIFVYQLHPSLSRRSYFIIIIDDYTWKTWGYFLKEKSKALDVLKKFKLFVDKKTRLYIKAKMCTWMRKVRAIVANQIEVKMGIGNGKTYLGHNQFQNQITQLTMMIMMTTKWEIQKEEL